MESYSVRLIKSLYYQAGFVPTGEKMLRLKSQNNPMLLEVWEHSNGQKKVFSSGNFFPFDLFEETT